MRYVSAQWKVLFFLLLFLAGRAAAGEDLSSGPLWIDQLAPADRLEIRTPEHVLRVELIDPENGEALAAVARDGLHFGPTDRVYLLGATPGRHTEGLMVVRMGCIEIGKRLELAVGDHEPANRRLTGPVEHIQVWKSAHASLP